MQYSSYAAQAKQSTVTKAAAVPCSLSVHSGLSCICMLARYRNGCQFWVYDCCLSQQYSGYTKFSPSTPACIATTRCVCLDLFIGAVHCHYQCVDQEPNFGAHTVSACCFATTTVMCRGHAITVVADQAGDKYAKMAAARHSSNTTAEAMHYVRFPLDASSTLDAIASVSERSNLLLASQSWQVRYALHRMP